MQTNAQLWAEIDRDIPEDWDKPSEIAISTAEALVGLLDKLEKFADRINQSANGGYVFYFYGGERHAHLEVHDSGEIVAGMMIRGGDPQVWAVALEQHALLNTFIRLQHFAHNGGKFRK